MCCFSGQVDRVEWTRIFFDDLQAAFPIPAGPSYGAFGRAPVKTLAVVTVGDFVASFGRRSATWRGSTRASAWRPAPSIACRPTPTGGSRSSSCAPERAAGRRRCTRWPSNFRPGCTAKGLVDGDAPVSTASIFGVRPNQDLWVTL